MPLAVARWLRSRRPNWEVFHISDLGLRGSVDHVIFDWAQDNGCIKVSYDKDFGDLRGRAAGAHRGIIRLRVRPTTEEETIRALGRLLNQTDETELKGALVIVGRNNIRVRPGGQLC